MKRIAFSILALLLASAGAQAKVELASVFGDNMVLQQQANVYIWGTAKSNCKVSVKPSWEKGKYLVDSESDGSWSVIIPTPAAGGPYTIAFSDGGRETTVIRNVLLGEVWFCSGQSNMEMPVKGFWGQPVEGSADVILSAKPSTPIRICTVEKQASAREEKDCRCSWQEHTPAAVADASAVAYFFAQKLHDALGVPVGLLISDWGGTPIEAWMNRETLRLEFKGEFSFSHLDSGYLPKVNGNCSPCALYNGQVAPLVPFTFRGMLWYQGESNRDRPEQYARLQVSYARMMRFLFRNPDAPFYYVQIAPYNYKVDAEPYSAYLREAQERALSEIPNSGMVSTLDVGEYATIHPSRKREVGYRLAYLALTGDYGVKEIDSRSPSFESAEFKDGKAIVTMNVGPMGLAPLSAEIGGFQLAGEDRVFHPAVGIPVADKVTVSSPEVPEPVAVRYCFDSWCTGTLFNSFGIPAYPFRSDNW